MADHDRRTGDPAPSVEPRRHRAVRWLSPTELVRTGVTVLLGSIVAGYADKRDVMSGATFAQGVFDHDPDREGEFWFDFVSDTGDGFAAMCTVATLLGAPTLEVGDRVLPRGEVLLMGGDEVYPVAGVAAYEERLEAPLAAQFVPGTAPAPTVYAIPGNHDWYDGLTAFLRVFCQGRPLGGWLTRQRRSYVALRLPHDWWVLAVDIQLDTYIDATQLDYFHAAVAEMGPDAQIILCTAAPAWYGAQDDDTHSMDRLTFFLREILGGRDLPVRLVLTGDSHHYARYSPAHSPAAEGPEQVLLTAGHGGAYTSSTHFLPETLEVPTDLAGPGTRRTTTTRPYRRADDTWPSPARSRAEAWRVLWRLPLRNGPLVPLLALVQALVIGCWVHGPRPVAVIVQLLFTTGAVAFTAPHRTGWWRRVLAGTALGVPAFGVGVVAIALVERWGLDTWDVGGLAGLGGVVLVAGLVAGEVLAVYLLLAGRWANRNELFAAQGIEDHKGFVRLCLDADGTLTLYPLGVTRVPRRTRWTWTPDATPRFTSDDRIAPELIEPPVVLRRRRRHPRDRPQRVGWAGSSSDDTPEPAER